MKQMNENFVLKGTICYSDLERKLHIVEGGYVVCEDHRCAGVFLELPEEYEAYPVKDFGDGFILPGMTDLHVHAPQYTFRGSNMDLELLDWLNTVTFPEEAKYADEDYARAAYKSFAKDLKNSVTTRACIFGTLHVEGTKILMDELEATGLKTYVGKVNMDRNCPDYLKESSVEAAVKDTIWWLDETAGRYENVMPMLTPRFTPACSDALMKELKKIQENYHLPVQSHLSENKGEIAWVQELCPNTSCYGEAYDQFGLFGGEGTPTIMAHCVHSGETEKALMKERGVFIAHCPISNTNLSSGIAPAAHYVRNGYAIGLGSDVAGGHALSLFTTIVHAIQVSKLRWRLVDDTEPALSLEEAFYMATLGGGQFFGKVGSFLPGYEFDAVIIEDPETFNIREYTGKERLERLIYLHDQPEIKEKYIAGNRI